MKKIAIIGSGISGLGCAYTLRDKFQLTVFEASERLGGHANTVDVCLNGQTFGVDTGFLVYNERTYPHLIKLFDDLRIKVAASEMSFSVSRRDVDREWCGSSLSSLLAQPSNALSPRFWSMVKDILRFNREATALARDEQEGDGSTLRQKSLNEPLSQYLMRMNYGQAFSEDYLLPMAAAIWSCPISSMASFPIGSFIRFFHNHGLLQVTNRPQWFTCEGGARHYVQAISDALTQLKHSVRVNTPVLQVEREAGHIDIRTHHGVESFDGVVMACHSDQALKLLARPSAIEHGTLSSITYQDNLAYLHCDRSMMPKRTRAWAAWNYVCDRSPDESVDARVSVTYWLNRLQPLPSKTNLFVSLNPISLPREDSVFEKISYAHPVFDAQANRAQTEIPALQGVKNTWYAGAWCGYGFHEDGLKSGIDAARRLCAQMSAQSNHTLRQALAA
jgi:uncharacterized protein